MEPMAINGGTSSAVFDLGTATGSDQFPGFVLTPWHEPTAVTDHGAGRASREIWNIRLNAATGQKPAPAESWLPEGLQDVDQACAEAGEEGYVVVPEVARAAAERMLAHLAERVSRRPIVHSTPEGGIALDFRNDGRDAAVLFLCEPDGEGVCLSQFIGKHGRTRYSNTDDLLEAGGWHALRCAGLLSN